LVLARVSARWSHVASGRQRRAGAKRNKWTFGHTSITRKPHRPRLREPLLTPAAVSPEGSTLTFEHVDPQTDRWRSRGGSVFTDLTENRTMRTSDIHTRGCRTVD